jgi:hypothetical protein
MACPDASPKITMRRPATVRTMHGTNQGQIQHSPHIRGSITLQVMGLRIRIQPIRPVATKGTACSLFVLQVFLQGGPQSSSHLGLQAGL